MHRTCPQVRQPSKVVRVAHCQSCARCSHSHIGNRSRCPPLLFHLSGWKPKLCDSDHKVSRFLVTVLLQTVQLQTFRNLLRGRKVKASTISFTQHRLSVVLRRASHLLVSIVVGAPAGGRVQKFSPPQPDKSHTKDGCVIMIMLSTKTKK